MFSLPWQTLPLNPLAAFGIILTLGVLGGHIATRTIRLPRVTGYILTGLIIGPVGLRLISPELIEQANFFIQLGVGLMLFEQGRRLDINWLVRERALLITATLVSLFIFAGIFALLTAVGLSIVVAVLLASLLLATSPALMLDIINESRAEGQMTERLAAHTGISNLIALVAFAITLAYAHLSSAHDLDVSVGLPLWLTVGSTITGLLVGFIAVRLNAWLGGREQQAQGVLLCAMIALTVGITTKLGMLPTLALLVFGIAVRNLARQYVFSALRLIPHGTLFYVALFVAAGTQMHLPSLRDNILLIFSIVGLRSLISIVGWSIASRANGLVLRRGIWLAMALMPMPMWANALFVLIAQATPLDAYQASQLALGTLCLTQLLGPILTQQALRRSGECPATPMTTQ